MSEQSSNIVSKVWGLCNPLRDDGVSYGDYLEQLTYLIFLKMSDEYSRPPYKRETGIPKGYTWSDMNTLKGAELENQYRAILERLGDEGGILGQIFKGAVNKISNVSILYRVVQMIDKENWVSMSSDVKGEIYEGLLQKNAEDVKSGAGQYFTPRPLIKAMVACLRPEPNALSRTSTTRPSHEISAFIASLDNISAGERRSKLTSRPMFEIVCLLYAYNKIVSPSVKKRRIKQLTEFVNGRMQRHIDYFEGPEGNKLIATSFEFLKKVVDKLN